MTKKPNEVWARAVAVCGLICLGLGASAVAGASESLDEQYVRGPEWYAEAGVPRGQVFEFVFDRSAIFPGTSRTITVYVPAQYTAATPACVYIGFDGLIARSPGNDIELPIVFDHLIHAGEMPVTIAIGLASGSVAAPGNPRFNRSFEFDSLSDRLARFLLEELFPELERRTTPGGLPIRLSRDPNDRAAGGASTGGIGAFTLAWERPDAFRRVFTAVGTFVGMRGGDRYPVLVRKTEPKPIRIFMQDGANDQWLGGPEVGDWWMSNQAMERALTFAGYDVKHVWGQGTHDMAHALAVFPDAMRFLWKDWPQPVTSAAPSQNTFLRSILRGGEGWHALAGTYRADGLLATNGRGEVVFQDAQGGQMLKVSATETLAPLNAVRGLHAGMAFGPDDRLYVADTAHARILAYGENGRTSVVATGIRGRNMLVNQRGAIYVSEPSSHDSASGKVWLIQPGGKKTELDGGLKNPSGIALSPDGLWLAVAESGSHLGYSYRALPDGTVEDKQPFYWFHVPDTADDSGARAWTMDREGRLYAATRMGVQVFDRNGRVRAILPVPGGEATGLSFGGALFDVLYVTCADGKVYARRLNARGAMSWSAPIALPEWGSG